MGLNVGSINYSSNQSGSVIDAQALARVKEQILNPENNTINTSKVDLSKFNRVSLGTDLYSSKTSNETALQASKAATDFGVNLSESFSSNVQYLNSQAAQSLFTSKENNGTAAISIENAQSIDEDQIVLASSQISETQNTDKNKKGSNPFAFYMQTQTTEENEDNESNTGSINIFA